MTERQRTIAREVTYTGIGLHTGNPSAVTFRPAPPDTGIRFVRVDQNGARPPAERGPGISADLDHVLGIVRGTTIGSGPDQAVHTVEHLLAACSGMGVDNLLVEVSANEPPVGDGSSLVFVEMLEAAGTVEQEAARREIRVESACVYSSDGTYLVALPYEGLRISCTICFSHPLVKTQYASFEITPETFRKEIAPARTFCFDHEIEALQRRGLALGGSLDNAIVVGEKRIHNPGPLRFEEEFVRHKILDILGDLALLGCRLSAHVLAIRPGHGHNIAFAKMIRQTRAATAARPAFQVQ